MDTLILSIFLLFCLGQGSTQEVNGQVGYCDQDYFIPKSKVQCDGGIYFGHRAPKCVCIKGIYRMYLSNCEVADGFATEVCTLLNDVETGVKVKGLKLTKDLDFSSDNPAVVYERSTARDPEWFYVGVNERNKISSKFFYTLKAKPIISTKGRHRRICVERDEHHDTGSVCLYRHTDNIEVWPIVEHGQKNVEIFVVDDCSQHHHDWQALKPFKFFWPLNLTDSDCQLPCDKSNAIGVITQPITKEGTPNLEGNCTDPHDFIEHENNFLDRRLIHFLLMKALKKDPKDDIIVPPKDNPTGYVYTLFDKVNQIAMETCSFQNLPVTFMKRGAELFKYLLQGNSWKHDIHIQEQDFLWVQSILDKCYANLTHIILEPDNPLPGVDECVPNRKATGYCKQGKGSDIGRCQHVPVILGSKYSDYRSKHYVPEVVWLFLDIVHMNCFSYFEESYRMFHLLEQAIEKLFIVPIKDLWHNPTWTPNRKVSIMGSGVEDIMWNLEICGESIYHYHGNKLHRLKRPVPFHYHSRKIRSAEHLSPNFDVFCAKRRQDFQMPEGCSAIRDT